MPHQCVRCNTFYQDGAKEILSGCPCGARLFFYVRKKKLKEAEKMTAKLSKKDKEEIEKDILEMVGAPDEDSNPVILDLESIKIVKPGKYELDLVHIFKKDPLVFKLEEGKYIIDLPQTFQQERQK